MLITYVSQDNCSLNKANVNRRLFFQKVAPSASCPSQRSNPFFVRPKTAADAVVTVKNDNIMIYGVVKNSELKVVTEKHPFSRFLQTLISGERKMLLKWALI